MRLFRMPTFFTLVVFVVIFFPLYRYVQFGDFLTHDRYIHLLRINEYYGAFTAGQIPPRLAPGILDGTGYPLFLMNYQLPYFTAIPFLAIGLSADTAYRLMMLFTYVIYVVAGFKFFRNITTLRISLLATLSLVYSPYLFANIFVRGALPEFMASSMLLCILYLLTRGPKRKYPVILIGILIGLQLLTQAVVALISIPLIFLVVCLFGGKKYIFQLRTCCFSYLIGGLLASYILLPAVFERHYFQFDQKASDIVGAHFISLPGLLKIPLFSTNSSPMQLSFMQTILVLFGPILLFGWVKLRDFRIIVVLVFTWILIFLVTPFSGFLWKNVIFLQAVLFPWRLLTLISITSCIFLILLVNRKRDLFFLMLFLSLISIFFTRHFIKPIGFSGEFVQNKDQFITGTTDGEFTPQGARIDKELITVPRLAVLDGSAIILQNEQSIGYWRGHVSVEETAMVQAKVLYFPGWRFYLDGREQVIAFPVVSTLPNHHSGLPVISVSPGIHTLEFRYEETSVRRLGNMLSLLTFLAIVFFYILRNFRKKFSLKYNRN